VVIEDRIGKYLQKDRAWYNRDVSRIKYLTIHHDAIPHDDRRTADSILDLIMSTHVKNGWPGASYHYFIHTDGTIYQLNKHSWVTWHDGHNWDSLGILLTGYFHDPHNNKPTDAQLKSMRALLNKLRSQYDIPINNVLGHRQRMVNSCPGDLLYPEVERYRKNPEGEQMDFIDTDIPTEIEDEFKLKKIERYNKYWSFREIIADWVILVSEYDKLKDSSKKEALELTKRVSELDKVRVSLQKDINSLEANLTALEALRVEQGEESLEKHQELQKQYEEVSSAHEDLLKAYTNLQADLDAGYADQIKRLKQTIKDQERRILQLQRPKPSAGEAFELLIEALREAIIK